MTVLVVFHRVRQTFCPHVVLDELVHLGFAKFVQPRGLLCLFQEPGYVFVSDPDPEGES